MEPSDEELMRAYATGDRGAFDALFARLAPRVHGFFLRSFGSSPVADDLMQLTFLKLHRARSEYRESDGSVRAWAFAIAARVRIDELRRRYRLPATAGEEALLSVEDSGVPPPDVRIEARDVRDRVRAALDMLPESQRAIVHLHRYEGLSFGDIARALGSTEGAVKLRAFRAYEKLRVALADLDPVSA